jgi:hypothetical protein
VGPGDARLECDEGEQPALGRRDHGGLVGERRTQNYSGRVAGGTALNQLDCVLCVAQAESQHQIAGLTGRRLLWVGQEDVSDLSVALAGHYDLKQGRTDGDDQVRRGDHKVIVL